MSDGIKITKLQFNPSELERSLDAIQNKVNSKIETVSGEVGKDILDLAKENDIAVMDYASKQFIQPQDVDKFGTMNEQEIKDYYDSLSEPMKKSFVTYFFNKCCEKDPQFYTLSKMNTVNVLIGGRLFDNLISVCSNQQKK